MSHTIATWLVCWGLVLSVQAQVPRDPTQPPVEMGSEGAAKTEAGPLESEGVAVIVRNGKPYLVSGTRLYAVGQTMGHMRIERITETEVWLKEGAVLRKVPRFSGVAAPVPSCGVVPSQPVRVKASAGVKAKTSSSSNASKVVPCDGAQP
jgi:hypothetical protein